MTKKLYKTGTITEVYQLRDEYENLHYEGHFFDHETLRFFGERWSEMKILKHHAQVTDWAGKTHECYILSSKQHKVPGKPRVYHYFDINTLDTVEGW